MIFISSTLLFGRGKCGILSCDKKYSVTDMFEIEIAPRVSFHVFRDAVEGLNRTIGKPFLVDFPILVNDFNANEGVNDFLKVLI